MKSEAMRPLTSWETFLLLTIAAVGGAAVMEVEILGARVMGPWFGVGFFVWTALITVTLLSLSAGYYLGGRLSDRTGSLKVLGCLIAAAGGWLFLLPLIRVPLLKAAAHLGVRAGVLSAAVVLFGPPLTLLGMVSPFVAKLLLADIRDTGRTMGRLWALSTMGSFVGTLAAGFWLIPAFHVNQIAAGTACVLLALGAGAVAVSSRRPLILLAALPGLLLLRAPAHASVVLPGGTKAQVIHRGGGFYGPISIVDYTYGERHTREMLVDGVIQGGMDMATGESPYPFTYDLEIAGLLSNPSARRALVIGLGPGILPGRLTRYGMTGTVVEIDPRVVSAAERYFAFHPGAFQVAVEDGRLFLETTGDTFDLVLLDAFAAENEPAHLLTKEAFQSVARHLSPGGALVINLVALAPPVPAKEGKLLDSVWRTMAAAFPEVRAYYAARSQPGTPINFMLVGRVAGGSRGQAPPHFLPVHPMAESMMEGFLASSYVPAPGAGSEYTDDWCPVEAQGADCKLAVRQAYLQAMPAAILLD